MQMPIGLVFRQEDGSLIATDMNAEELEQQPVNINSAAASFTPVTVTVETLQILAKQEKYADLLALYMACVEITTWQKSISIKATKEFMMKRLGWGEDRFSSAKAKLVSMGLIENTTRKDSKGLVTGHYVKVKHIVSTPPSNPGGGLNERLDSEGTSTNNLQLSASNSKSKSPPKEKELLEIVNKVTGRNFRTLPSKDVKKVLSLFSLVEIETALRALAADNWHQPKLKEFSINYLIRPTTIDAFVTRTERTGPTEEEKQHSARVQEKLRKFREGGNDN